METRTYWPFGGFFLKLQDEENGTHQYQDYQKELAEHPIAEEEKRRRHASMQAALEELERANEEARRKEDAVKPENEHEVPDSILVSQELMEADLGQEERRGQLALGEMEQKANDVLADDPCTEALVVPEPNQRARVSDLIKDGYKDWHGGMRIVFDAGTNSGKTYFILNVLLPWAKKNHKKILYLCNRSALRDQIRQELEKLGRKEITFWDYDFERDESAEVTEIINEYGGTIYVENYQWLESFYLGNPKGASDYLRGIAYVVADEYHYQLTDPVINDDIDVSYKLLNEWTEIKPVIFMSATAHPFFNRWKRMGDVLQENYYYIPPDYSYVSHVKFYWTDEEEMAVICQEAQRGKVLVFADSVGHIEKIRGALEAVFPGEIATACSEYRPEAKNFDGVAAVLQDEKLCKRISLVTTVLYNGINIKDPELKCIISRLWDANVNGQILGRKRPLGKEDTCSVYFREYSHGWIKRERELIRKYQLEPAEQWKKQKKGREEEWLKYLYKKGTVKLLDKKCRTVYREKYGNGWVWHRRAEFQYLVQMDMLEQMMKDGYQRGLLKEISESLIDKIEPLRFKELEDYINEHLGEKIPGEIMRKELTERGRITNPEDRHKDKKPPSLTLINKRLEKYGVRVVSKQEWISSTERMRFWILCKLYS